jgi:hypothetical protein
MYSSEYTSGFFGPAASHLAAPPSPRYEGNVRQAPSRVLKKSASIRRPLFGFSESSNKTNQIDQMNQTNQHSFFTVC